MTKHNIEIVSRFFEALDILIRRKEYDSYNDFAVAYGIDRSQLMRSKKNHASKRFELSWISPLIIRHGLDAHWLFMGIGRPFHKIPKLSSIKA